MTDSATEPPLPPKRHELLDPDAFPAYLIHDRREIAKLMHTLATRNVLLAAHVAGHAQSFMTVVLAVGDDGDSVLLDASPDDTINASAMTAGQLVCTTRLDGIRVQFSVSTPVRVAHEGYAALRSALPDRVLRLQRREFYRLTVPSSDPVTCTISAADADGTVRSIALRVLDISNGGIAVVVPPEGIRFEPGMEFPDCTLAIPDGGTATVRLRVRNVFATGGGNQHKKLRAGCEFIAMPTRFAAQIQRYIFKVERERRNLSG
jgi:c-di-GMP-binding flagellar brake protein YcgR